MEGVRFPDQPPIPGYEPIRPLGKNLVVVYLARHSASGVHVALKVWPLELERHARDVDGPLAHLHHPNIIRLFEMGQFEGMFFCAVEYVEQTLADKLRQGPLPGHEVARIACLLASALQHAREHGMIPLGFSPKSIGLTCDNVPKLLGSCPTKRLAEPWKLFSPALMPPEWVAGADRATEASLVYRMGTLMYELLTARPPFAANGAVAMLQRVLHEMPEHPRTVNLRVGRDLDAVCMKCLAKQPNARYAFLQDLMDDLKLLTRES